MNYNEIFKLAYKFEKLSQDFGADIVETPKQEYGAPDIAEMARQDKQYKEEEIERKKHLPTFDEIKRRLQKRLGNVSISSVSYYNSGFNVDINMDLSKSGYGKGKEQSVADNVLIFMKQQWPDIYWGIKINGVGFAKTTLPAHTHDTWYNGDDIRNYSR
jgi:hypothetical protein